MAISDFCILTPLDEEWSSVQDIIVPSKISKREVRRDPIIYYLWADKPSSRKESSRYLFAAAAIGKMGLTSAASFTSLAIHHWRPDQIIILGIAGGFKPEKQSLGDVIVSSEVFGYAIDDISGPDENRKFRPTGHHAGTRLINEVRALKNNKKEYENWQKNCLEAALKDKKLPKIRKPPKIHLGVTASGNTVAKSKTFAEKLKESIHSKIIGVEMEANGVFEAVWGSGTRADVLMVRGISDFADDNKKKVDEATGGAWRRWAAANTARLFSSLIDRNPVEKSVSKPIIINSTFSLNRDILIKDGTYLDGDGKYNLAFPKLIERNSSTPEIVLTLFGLTASGRKIQPTRSLCTIDYLNMRRSLRLLPIKTDSSKFVLPRTEEEITVSVSLSFEKCEDELKRIKICAEDEFGRKTMEDKDAV